MRRTASVCLAAAVLASCTPKDDAPPRDRPVFPTGLAVVPGGAHLLVVSSNFDLTFRQGAVLAVDLDRVDEALADGDGTPIVADAFTSSVEVPSFGDRPVVTSGGERAFLATRAENLVVELGVDDGALSCEVAEPREGEVPGCGRAPGALLVRGNDPFHLAIVNEARDADGALVRVDGLTAALTSPDVQFWSADLGRNDERRFAETGLLRVSEEFTGLRGLALVPRTGRGPMVFAAAERRRDSFLGRGTSLVAFEPRRGAPVATLDLTEATGALAAREIAVVPSLDPAVPPSALLLLMRSPDSLVRVDLDEQPDGRVFARVGGVQPTCDDPSKITVVRLDPDEDVEGDEVVRALVTCFGDDALLAIDPDTLVVTHADRFFGRGPYDVVHDAARQRAYVSFFSEGTIGVFDLVADGAPALVRRGKVGEPLPPPETGRE